MMADMAVELRKHNIAAVSLWPGAVLTEHINDLVSGKQGEIAAKQVCHDSVQGLHVGSIKVCPSPVPGWTTLEYVDRHSHPPHFVM